MLKDECKIQDLRSVLRSFGLYVLFNKLLLVVLFTIYQQVLGQLMYLDIQFVVKNPLANGYWRSDMA